MQYPAQATFLEGPAGTGKTGLAIEHLLNLVNQGVPADSILILVPQRTLAFPYYRCIRDTSFPAGSIPTVVTLGGLAQRMVALFWPLAASLANLSMERQPVFLTLETAQYYLALIVRPLLEKGYFESVTIDPNRLLSQIVDNLNKATVVGFPYTEFGERLQSSWTGKPEQIRVYREAQECANLFRQYCAENNLLDFSLQMELFLHHLWPSFVFRNYLKDKYRHLIYENIEEDVPVAHDLILEWLPDFESALFLYDTQGGYRSFLGADPQGALRLKEHCSEVITMEQSHINPRSMLALQTGFEVAIRKEELEINRGDLKEAFSVHITRFFPEMIETITAQIKDLVENQQVSPGDIAILSPFVSDALRFSLVNRLEAASIPIYSHRPSRSLHNEPATQCLLTLARLAHPGWENRCNLAEVRLALVQAIEGLDLVRADLLAKICFRPRAWPDSLSSFEDIQAEMQERITFSSGQRYEVLRQWMIDYRAGEQVDLDIFLARIFGEVLSQPGFGFHQDYAAATTAARLIESIQKFRQAAACSLQANETSCGQEYIKMLEEGVIAAQSLLSWEERPQGAVFLAPAYTFLMANFPVRYQFWLDIGSMGWWERLSQPLTHPFILSRNWVPGSPWTDANEYAVNQNALLRLTTGLVRHCRDHIFLYATGMDEQGNEQRGALLQAVQKLSRMVKDG